MEGKQTFVDAPKAPPAKQRTYFHLFLVQGPQPAQPPVVQQVRLQWLIRSGRAEQRITLRRRHARLRAHNASHTSI